MDVLILCGGFATRLEPITLFVPKPLLPIGGRPILDYIIEDVAGNPDINRIIISTNKKFENHFKYWISLKNAQSTREKLELVTEPTMHNGNKLGAIKGIKYAIDNAKIQDDLMIIAGDNFYDSSISSLLLAFKASARDSMICVHDVGSIEEAKKLGVVQVRDGIITGFEEKPTAPKSTLSSTGIYIYPKKDLPMFGEYLSQGNTPDAPGYFLQWFISKATVRSFVIEGRWFDIGTLETYRKVYALFDSASAVNSAVS